jgi:hypothetical protein
MIGKSLRMNDPTDLDGRSVFLGRHGLNEDLALQQPRTYLGLLSLGERIDLQEPTRTRNLAPNPKARAVAAFNSVPSVLGETKTQTKESTTTRTLLALSRELRRSVIVGNLMNRHRVSVPAIEAALPTLYDLFYRLLRAAMPTASDGSASISKKRTLEGHP